MNTRTTHRLLAAIAGMMILTACSAFGRGVQLRRCDLGWAEAECGTLRVYENRTAQGGRMIDLNIVVIRAQSEHPAPDPIFYLAGGPGVAATEDAKRQQFPFSLMENHDLVFVDQRGTGGSNQVLIPNTQPDLSGLTAEEMDARMQGWVDQVLGEINMDPRFYTTSAAMDDLDEVRQALGYDKINLVGYSYGATAAQYYLLQYEEHVRTMALGSGSLLDVPIFELWASSAQKALNLVFERCQQDAACQAAFPDLPTEFAALLARLADEPVTATLGGASSDNVTFTADYFAAVVAHMTKDAKNVATLPFYIHSAYQHNNWNGFTRFIASEGGYEWWGDQIMERVIRCDEPWAAFDPAAVAELSQGSYLAGWNTSLAQNQALSCKYTPRSEMPEGSFPQSGSKVPVLILNGELDPIDPPENMAGANDLWPNSLALVGPFQAHSISDMSQINCWFSILDQFIQSGSVEGLDTSCMQSANPPAFVIP